MSEFLLFVTMIMMEETVEATVTKKSRELEENSLLKTMLWEWQWRRLLKEEEEKEETPMRPYQEVM